MFEANEHKFSTISKRSNELEKRIRELEREKIKIRDERTAWRKQNLIQSRVETRLDLFEKQLKSLGSIYFKPDSNIVKGKSDNDLLVILSDLHLGQCFDSYFGKYNTDIAVNRIGEYLNRIIKIANTNKSENCYISLQGDLISNSIHKTLAITNSENVIDQIKLAIELISSFCYSLCSHFKNVYINGVCGNHSRIDKKEDALHDERLDDLILWSVKHFLEHINNFHVLKNDIDTGISKFCIRDKIYIGVHGDFDLYNKQGVSNLVMMIGEIPYAVTYGHLHTCSVNEANGIKIIRGGSLAGSGDSYTIEKRLTGKPSQMVCMCTKNGIEGYYIIELN